MQTTAEDIVAGISGPDSIILKLADIHTVEERRKVWAGTLRAGVYPAGKSMLRKQDGSFCAQGVACDLYDPDAWSYDFRSNHEPGDIKTLYDPHRLHSLNSGKAAYSYMPDVVKKFYGLNYGQASIIMGINDNVLPPGTMQQAWNQIADYLESLQGDCYVEDEGREIDADS